LKWRPIGRCVDIRPASSRPSSAARLPNLLGQLAHVRAIAACRCREAASLATNLAMLRRQADTSSQPAATAPAELALGQLAHVRAIAACRAARRLRWQPTWRCSGATPISSRPSSGACLTKLPWGNSPTSAHPPPEVASRQLLRLQADQLPRLLRRVPDEVALGQLAQVRASATRSCLAATAPMTNLAIHRRHAEQFPDALCSLPAELALGQLACIRVPATRSCREATFAGDDSGGVVGAVSACTSTSSRCPR
jgi:hypothetical protein